MIGFDQAHRLRDAMLKKKDSVSKQELPLKEDGDGPIVICVSSGKGGVGKSNFTINTALAIRAIGKRVIVIDADLGLANVEILMGIRPRYTLMDVVKKHLNIEEIIEEGIGGLKIISGGSGIQMMSELSQDELDHLLSNMSRLRKYADYIFIDTGSGISKSVTSFVRAAHELIVITTPEPPAMADAYALVKILSKEKVKKISLVVNRVLDEEEGEAVFNKLNSVSLKFLDRKLHYLGQIYNDENVSKSVRRQTPFYILAPRSKAKANIDVISQRILQMDVEEKGFSNFMHKLRGLFFNGGRNSG